MRYLAALTFLLAQPAGWKPPAVRVQDEGELQGYVSTLNCVGAGISCSVGASVATLSVSGGGGGGGSPGGSASELQIRASGTAFGAYTGTGACAAGSYMTALDAFGAKTCATPAIPADVSAAHYVTTQAEAGLSAEAVLPTCTGTDKLTFNGTTISCAADQTGAGGGAPTAVPYWTGGSDATLSAEKDLSALSTGLVINTAGTPSTYAGTICSGQFPRALSATGAATCANVDLTGDVAGTLPIANGGTNGIATPTNGGIGYGTGSALAYTAAGTAGQVLTSNGAAAPTWQAAAGGGGSSGTVLKVKTADVTNSTTTPANIFTTAVASGTEYGFVCEFIAQGTSTSLPRYNINGPSASNVSFTTERYTTTSAQTLLVLQAFSSAAQTASCISSCTATNLPMHLFGSFTATASGTLAFMLTSSTSGQAVVVRRGSFCVVY